MTRQSFTVAGLVLASLTMASLAAAQQAAQPRWFVLHQEYARPGMAQQYEDIAREYAAVLRQHHDAMPTTEWIAVAGDDFVYTYLIPIENYAALDKALAGFGVVINRVGEAKWRDLMLRGGATTEYIRESIMMEDPSFSYVPATPRLKAEEEAYLHADFYYVQPGREPEAAEVNKQLLELYRKKGVPDGYRLFTVFVGPEMPLNIMVVRARDATDYLARERANKEMLGPEGQALYDRALALTRRFESLGGRIRPDLALEPSKTAPGR
jgi:hypothetical protein